MRAEVDGRLSDAQDIDPVKQGAREELTARPSFGLAPGLGKVLDVADRDIGRDVVPSLAGLGRRLFLVEASHRPLESLGVTIL
jgi:hypothetical protein